ncbi:MAG: aldehyde dehydrogenase (NADP(+)) [Bacteroidota bacterium]
MSELVQQIDAVMHRSRAAFEAGRTCSGNQRADFLDAIASGIEAVGPALLESAMRETNLPEARLAGERARTCNQLRQFSAMLREGSWVEARIDTALPDRQPLAKPDIRKMMVPLGPVVVFGASNFPLAYSTAGVDTASALAAGCSVVLKGHPAHPVTSKMVAEVIETAGRSSGMPDGFFIHVEAPGFEVGKLLVQHPLTKAVGFTGSFSGGKALYDYAQERSEPIPVFSEMGSINPVYLLPAALASRSEQIADQYAASITQSVGQFCTNPGLLLGLRDARLEAFSSQLAARLQKIAPAPMLHPGISKSFYHKRAEALKQSGVTMLATAVADEPEFQGVPTLASVDGATFASNPLLSEEVFGPYSLLVQAGSIDELTRIASSMPGQLTSTIIGDEADLKQHADFIRLVADKAGRVIINGVPTGVEVCPSMHHGGPFPATTDARFSSVGIDAVKRFVRPLSFQGFPQSLLPAVLRDENPMGIWRLFNNEWKK